MTANKHTPVDVLACLEHAFISLRIDGRVTESDQIDLARAAVAELIEAGMAATEEKMHDGASSREACDRLVAALSRARGAA